MSTEVGIAIPWDEILEEMNAVSAFTGARVQGLTDDGAERKKTAQIIALGALWIRWLSANNEQSSTKFAALAHEVAARTKASE